MNLAFDDNFSYEKVSNIIIDLGLNLTKIGLGSESEPRKIIHTPKFFNYEKFLNEDTQNQITDFNSENIKTEYRNLLAYRKDIKDLKFEIESFISDIFNNILQIKKQQRDKNYVCNISIDFSLDRILSDVYELIIKTILDNPLILNVKILPKSILPIFSSGFASGIVIDVGYAFTNIIPIINGFPLINKSKLISVGSINLEQNLKRWIVEENYLNGKRKIKNFESFSEDVNQHLNDLVVRCTFCVNKKLSNLLNDPEELNKLKNDNDYSKIDYIKNLQDFQISFLSRVKLGEIFFGNISNDEINIVNELLNVIVSLPNEDRKKLSQNIILSGGSSMLPGFYRRFIEEIEFFIETSDFEKIINLKEFIKIHKIIFPRNCLGWIGSSLINQSDKLNVKQFTVTREDFETYEKEKMENYDDEIVIRNPVEKILSYFK